MKLSEKKVRMKETMKILKDTGFTEEQLLADCGSVDAFAKIVHDITGGKIPVDVALPLKIENAYSNNTLILEDGSCDVLS